MRLLRIEKAAAARVAASGVLVALAMLVPAESHSQALDSTVTVPGLREVTIDLKRIGVVRAPSATQEQLDTLATAQGLTNERKLSEAYYVFDLPDSHLSRASLVGAIRQLEAVAGGVLHETGMVCGFAGGRNPALASDRFIAQFLPTVRMSQIDSMNLANRVQILEPEVFKGRHFLLELLPQARGDVLSMSRRYHESGLTQYAHPDWIRVLRFHEYRPNDTMLGEQWHHDNTGQGTAVAGEEGTEDADIDTPLAWEIVRAVNGAPSVVVAVIDGGYDTDHPELRDNLWSNTDGTHGWDYVDCKEHSKMGCGDSTPSVLKDDCPYDFEGDWHGTPVASLIAAKWDNATGGAGVCPTARLMLLRIWSGIGEEHLTQAFEFATSNGAQIISNSWGFDDWIPETPSLRDAIQEAIHPADGSLGRAVLFAMDYIPTGSSDCALTSSAVLANFPDAIAVGASSNRDRRLESVVCGDYLSVLGPADRGAKQEGTRNIATADIQGRCGFNEERWNLSTGDCPAEVAVATGSLDSRDYTLCFSGTSAATPIVAGVAGLLLTVEPTLAPEQIKALLQDTADKIEGTKAAYSATTGFGEATVSTPGNTLGASTHGFGRVNAFEAVKVAAPRSAGGRGGVDLFVRDNELDWGNTEQSSNTVFEPPVGSTDPTARDFLKHWKNLDIKIDGPPLQVAGTPTSRQFDEVLTDEIPLAGVTNTVYVRVRNRGPISAMNAKAKLYWAYMGSGSAPLPGDFWTGFAANTFDQTDWHWIDPKPGDPAATIATSGSTATQEARVGGGAEAAHIYTFEWTPPDPDPSLPNHYCLFTIVDAAGDATGAGVDHPGPYQKILDSQVPAAEDFEVDHLVPWDNNVGLRNYAIAPTQDESGGANQTSTIKFFVRNPLKEKADFILKPTAPRGWQVSFKGAPAEKPFSLNARAKRLVQVVVRPDTPRSAGTVSVTQERVVRAAKGRQKDPIPARTVPVGGFEVEYRPLAAGK